MNASPKSGALTTDAAASAPRAVSPNAPRGPRPPGVAPARRYGPQRLGVICRTLGVLCVLFCATLLPPIGISLYYADGESSRFAAAGSVALLAGLVFWLPFRRKHINVRSRDGFLIVGVMWTAMSALGAVPFMLSLGVSFADGFFESAAGYTTTAATALVDLDRLAPSILFYRQEIQWLGGLGVIVLAIALLPMLGIGGMQLYKADTPGPFKDERLTPRITRTARNVCGLYVLLTALCALAFWLAGMGAFDAIAHSFSTLSTGGYSTHDANLAFFNSPAIEAVAIIFMLIGGISFNMHFVAWRTFQLHRYGQDTQTRAFVVTVLCATAADDGRAREHAHVRHGDRRAALRPVRGRERAHDDRLLDRGFLRVAARAAGADDLLELRGRLRRLDLGRAEDRALPRARQAGRRAHSQADPSAGGAADQGRRPSRA